MKGDFLRSIAQGTIDTAFGPFEAEVFAVGGAEVLVLHTANIPGVGEGVLCRIQSECVAHVFHDKSCDCDEQISAALGDIRRAEAGLLIYLRQEGMGLGISGKLSGTPNDWRSYHAAVEILRYYGVRSLKLLSLNIKKIEAIRLANITIQQSDQLDGSPIVLGRRIARLVEQVRQGSSIRPIKPGAPFSRVLVLGDLNLDLHRNQTGEEAVVGGTGFNAACALKKYDFTPIIFGKIGQDEAGSRIRAKINEAHIDCLLGVHQKHPTGRVNIFRTEEPTVPFQYEWDKRNNANDYDAYNLAQAIELMGLGPEDYVFVSSYLLVQKFFDLPGIREILTLLRSTGARLVLDLVRKSLAPDVLKDCGVQGFNADALKSCLQGTHLHAIVGELVTFERLGLAHRDMTISSDLLSSLQAFFECDWVICRYVDAGHDHICQLAAEHSTDKMRILFKECSEATDMPIGHGDIWFAKTLRAIREYTKTNHPTPRNHLP